MAILLVGGWYSKCSACKHHASPYETHHFTRLGYDPGDGKGCGEEFTGIAPETYYGDDKERLLEMRPDLEWVGFDWPN